MGGVVSLLLAPEGCLIHVIRTRACGKGYLVRSTWRDLKYRAILLRLGSYTFMLLACYYPYVHGGLRDTVNAARTQREIGGKVILPYNTNVALTVASRLTRLVYHHPGSDGVRGGEVEEGHLIDEPRGGREGE
ncbi:hypothetical protein EDC04DRAFT_2603819 [Pisolithus marmoratus]|nr:hypothetical protein EDC04DRAFT_2603819 [Pisolithus marmoratus]